MCCKSRFAPMVKNSAGYRRGFRVKMWGVSSPHVKLAGDLANVSDAIRIGDCFPFRNFAKNQSPCNFRLLQQYPPVSDCDSDLPSDRQGSRATDFGWSPHICFAPDSERIAAFIGPRFARTRWRLCPTLAIHIAVMKMSYLAHGRKLDFSVRLSQ
jgi:hypothetical protein